MKKSILTFAFLISGLFVVSQLNTSCSGKGQAAGESHDHMEADTTQQHDGMKMDSTQMAYACPMHPEVTGKEGDKCSKCGMNLELVKSDSTKMDEKH